MLVVESLVYNCSAYRYDSRWGRDSYWQDVWCGDLPLKQVLVLA